MQILHAETALLADGWASNVRLTVGADGRIATVEADATPLSDAWVSRTGLLLPAPANVHSHAFQRAAAGRTESRAAATGGEARDSFWTWRTLIHRFLDQLTADDIEAIAAMVQVEMLEAGYASVGEFHYVHHQPGGAAYDDPGETSGRVAAAAAQTGIGLTHLPVLYMQGGVAGEPLAGGQMRFGTNLDGFTAIMESATTALAGLPADARLGIAPHSLRAVAPEALRAAADVWSTGPVHIHIAEQPREVAEVEAAYGARPVDWLLRNLPVDRRWCLIHATHMTGSETDAMAASGAVAGLCPITEANLGDGIFDAARFLAARGAFGIGSDSNVRIALTEELRLLEYGQRLRDGARSVLAAPPRSTGRALFEGACRGGAQALGRGAGAIGPGEWADLLALDADALCLAGLTGDAVLDGWIFAGDDRLVRDVWSAGRHMVRDGRHIARDPVEARFRACLARLG